MASEATTPEGEIQKLKDQKTQLTISVAVSAVTACLSILNKFAIHTFGYPNTISLIQVIFILLGIVCYSFITKQTQVFSKQKAKIFIPTAIATAINFITNFSAL